MYYKYIVFKQIVSEVTVCSLETDACCVAELHFMLIYMNVVLCWWQYCLLDQGDYLSPYMVYCRDQKPKLLA